MGSAAMQAGLESESCCARWVKTVVDAAGASGDALRMLALRLRKSERWTKVEKRRQCASKHDIEARATELAPIRSSTNAIATAKTNSAAR